MQWLHAFAMNMLEFWMLEIILLVCEDRSAYLLTVLRIEERTCFSELEHMKFSMTQGVLNLKKFLRCLIPSNKLYPDDRILDIV